MTRRVYAWLLAVSLLAGCGDCGQGGGEPRSRTEPEGASVSSASNSPQPSPAESGAPEPLAVPEHESTSASPSSLEPSLTGGKADAVVTPAALVIELLSSGDAPRRELRHRAKNAASFRLGLTFEIGMMQTNRDQDAGERAVPALALDVTLVRVSQDPQVGWSMKIESASAVPDGDAERMLAEEVAPLLGTLVGQSATSLTDERASIPLRGPPPAGLQQEALQIWSSLEEALRDVEVPTPKEPVGGGAKWRVHERRRRGGIDYLRTTDFELRQGTGNHIIGTFSERPVDSGAKDSLVPEGLRVSPVGGAGKGNSKLELDEDLVVIRSEVALDSTTDVNIHGPGGSRPLESRIRLKQTVKGTRK